VFLFKILFKKILIPAEVATELYKNSYLKSVISKNEEWIEICLVKNNFLQSKLMEILDEGESAAISLAIERNANLILIDELKGKQIAQQYKLETTGTLGILIKAKQIGLLKAIKPDVLKLKNELNFWISESLIKDILQLASE